MSTSGFRVPPLPTFRDRLGSTGSGQRNAVLSRQAPRIPWDAFIAQHLDWRMGEHFGLIGPTGTGKTTMLISLLPLHPYTVMFATKPRDATVDGLLNAGYHKMERWRPLPAAVEPRRVLWPDASGLHSDELQGRVFLDAMERIYKEGGWTVAFDEMWYITNALPVVMPNGSRKTGLSKEVRTYLLQGRSLGISLLAATQRPYSVPQEIYTESTHLMFWQASDQRSLQRLAEINVRNYDVIRSVVMHLEKHQVLYINTRTGEMIRTRSPEIGVGADDYPVSA